LAWLGFFALTVYTIVQLPRYKSEKVLGEKLLQAISSGAGFDLS
jgi:ubiquitin-protein ligase E3 C